MRFVEVKSQTQQEVLALHRVRALLIHQRTALMNQMRGLLAECGKVVARGAAHCAGHSQKSREVVTSGLGLFCARRCLR
jgi:transposase